MSIFNGVNISTLILILFLGPVSFGKDLGNRLGIGIKNNTSEELPALAMVYYPNADIGITGGLGIDTRKDQSMFTANVGIRKVLFRENQMNFYYGGQVALVNYEYTGDKQSGFELNALFGTEFFLAGLDSLAFTFEGGVGMVSLKEVRFRTFGDHPLRAGIIFYF